MNFERLRQLLLQKAIEGKLVPQLDEEPPVEQIGEAPKDVPFAIPEKWKWTTIGASLQYGSSEQILGSDIPSDGWILDLEDIEKNTGKLLVKKRGCSSTSNKAVFRKGDVLYGKLRPYLNKCIVADEDGFSTTEIVAIRSVSGLYKFEPEYIKAFLMSPTFIQYANSLSYGVKMPRLGTKDAKATVIPVPPIEEQRRIVARLNALLATLKKAEDAHKDLQVLGDNLRSKMLQKAIEGKLVPQLEEEPSVEQIGEAPKNVPFAIPEKWKWVKLSSVGKIVGGGTPKTAIAEYWGGKIPWITPADLGKNKSKRISVGAKSITELGLNESSAKLMPKGSIVYSSRAPIGYVAIADNSLCTNQGCKSLVPDVSCIDAEFAYFCLIARTDDIKARASGTTFKEISGREMGETAVPLPPLAEQRRIVEKLNALLPLVDQMSA